MDLFRLGLHSDMQTIGELLVLLGTVAFAVTAVLAVVDRGIDLFGAIVLGIITAVGGGTIRDLILDVPVFWAIDTSYIWVALMASVFAFLARSVLARKHMNSLFLYIDALGAALFAVQGTVKVWDYGFGLPFAPVMLGVATAIGGGLIRDVLAGRRNLLMSRELYAVPITLGCVLLTLILSYLPEYRYYGSLGCFALIFGLRAGVIYWQLIVPDWFTTKAR